MSVDEGLAIALVSDIARGYMGALVHVEATVVENVEWIAHTLGLISEMISLSFSNCPFDRIGAFILPMRGFAVAFRFRRILVVDVGVNGYDGSWLVGVRALKLTTADASGKNIDSSDIPKSLQICATSIGSAFVQK